MTVPTYLRRIVDDAAIFPPGNAPLFDAVQAHRGHRTSAYADLVGPFVVGDQRLPELAERLAERTADEPLQVSVVVSGGAGALHPAVTWAARTAGLELRGLEIALRDEADLAHNARRVVVALDQLVASGDLDDDVPLHVEPPRLFGAEPSHGWLAALDELAAMDHRLKFRTGGPDGPPDVAELAACIGAALDRELRFKCTAGLHRAVRHRDENGALQHGFLNVLLATRASLDGDDPRKALGIDEPAAVRRAVEDAGDGLVSARRWFTSFGSCSVSEPIEDLQSLGLL